MAYDRDDYRGDRSSYGGGYRGDYGREREMYRGRGQRDSRGGDDDRGFFDRAGDEVRSWFGDEEAERRRERDDSGYGNRGDQDRDRYQGRSSYGRGGGYGRGGYGGERDRSFGERMGGYAAGAAAGYGASRGYDRSRDDYGRGVSGRDGEGFLDRAQNEVRSWFDGDDDDRGRSRQGYQSQPQRGRDEHGYDNWRTRQIEALDRDYDEYRRENQSKFDTEFHGWRQNRQSQRDLLNKVEEHCEVVGSDGEHVGKVDKVRGDRIILAKNDEAAGGHHHSIPSNWLQSVENDKITLNKSSQEAKRAWRDEDQNGAMFGGQGQQQGQRQQDGEGPHILNRSFSGTY